jgi:small-conductance mechanosensitive channel
VQGETDAALDALRRLLTDRFPLFVSILLLLVAVVTGLLVRRYMGRLLDGFDVPEAVEGTPFERTANRLGTSTVGIVSTLSGVFIVVIGAIVAFRIVGAFPAELLTARITNFLRQSFIAIIVLIVGLIAGDKAELYVGERLRGVKIPRLSLIPRLVKYTVFYVAVLIALAQLDVAIGALLVLLAAYAFAIVVLGAVALRDLLPSAAAGVFLLLTQPYGIGDRIEIDGKRGIVQEVDVLVTRIESDDEEFVVPNRIVVRHGVVRIRE